MSTCSICIDASAKALIDGAIAAGHTPKQAWEFHGRALKKSLSATYRHCKSHLERGTLTVSYVGDEMSGDNLADLVILKRSHIQQRDAAISRSDHATAAREGSAALTASTALLKAGIHDDEVATDVQHYMQLIRSIQTATKAKPTIADDIAEAARSLHFKGLASSAEQLAEDVREYLEKKETTA